jgi:hypothetical protein
VKFPFHKRTSEELAVELIEVGANSTEDATSFNNRVGALIMAIDVVQEIDSLTSPANEDK